MLFYKLVISDKNFEEKIKESSFTIDINDNNDMISKIVNKMNSYSYNNKDNIYIICSKNSNPNMFVNNIPQYPKMTTYILLEECIFNVLDKCDSSIYSFKSSKYDCIHLNNNSTILSYCNSIIIYYYERTTDNIIINFPKISLLHECEIREPDCSYINICENMMKISGNLNNDIDNMYNENIFKYDKLNYIKFEYVNNETTSYINNTIEDDNMNDINPYNIIRWNSNVYFYDVVFEEDNIINYIYDYTLQNVNLLNENEHNELFLVKHFISIEDFLLNNLISHICFNCGIPYNNFINDITISSCIDNCQILPLYIIIITVEAHSEDYISFTDNMQNCYNNFQLVNMCNIKILFFPNQILSSYQLKGKYIFCKIYKYVDNHDYINKWLKYFDPYANKKFISIPNKLNSNNFFLIEKKYYLCIESYKKIESINETTKMNNYHTHYVNSNICLTNNYIEKHDNLNIIFKVDCEIESINLKKILSNVKFINNYSYIDSKSILMYTARHILEKYILSSINNIYGNKDNIIIKNCYINKETYEDPYYNKYSLYNIFSKELYIYCSIELNDNFEYVDSDIEHKIGLMYIYTKFNQLNRPSIKNGEKYTLEFIIVKKEFIHNVINDDQINYIESIISSYYKDKQNIKYDYNFESINNLKSKINSNDIIIQSYKNSGWTIRVSNLPNFEYNGSIWKEIINNIIKIEGIGNELVPLSINIEILTSDACIIDKRNKNIFIVILIKDTEDPISFFVNKKRQDIQVLEYIIHNGLFETTVNTGVNEVILLEYEFESIDFLNKSVKI